MSSKKPIRDDADDRRSIRPEGGGVAFASQPRVIRPSELGGQTLGSAVFQAFIEPVLVIDVARGIVVEANQMALELLEKTAKEILGESVFQLLPDLTTEDLHGRADRNVRRTRIAPTQLLISEVPLGEETINVVCSPLDYGNSKLVMLVLRPTSRERNRELSFRDPLTGLPDRTWFDRRLHRAFHRAERKTGRGFAVLYVDVDHFKPINDDHGHAVGDELLCAIARRLLGCIRPQDMASRRGGDEFTILLDSIPGEATARRVAERILRAFDLPFSISEKTFDVSISVGICVHSPHHSHPDEMLDDADVSLYRVKSAGGEGYAMGYSSEDRRRNPK